jgi:hypothetical protein
MASQTYGVDNSNASFGTLVPSSNTGNIGAAGGRYSQLAPLAKTLQGGAGAFNPMFGRPIWSYVNIMHGPVAGPQPRLAQGTGLTGDPSLPGNAPQLPGYLSDNEYKPVTFPYDPVNNPVFWMHVPRTINTGTDGRDFTIGGWKPHDFTPAQRFNHQMRQAANWQVMEYPPDFRNLLSWQQVRKYVVQSFTLSPRPLDSANYFLGYQINPQVAAQIGQGTLGYMGSQ